LINDFRLLLHLLLFAYHFFCLSSHSTTQSSSLLSCWRGNNFRSKKKKCLKFARNNGKRKKYSQFHRFFSEGERRNLLDKYDKKTNEIKLFLFFTLFITYYVAYFLHHHFCRFVKSRYIYVFEKEWRRRKRPKKIAEKIFLGFPKFFHVLT
jgi:hypothetical protein